MSSAKFLLTLLFLPILLIFLLGWIIYWKFFGKKQAQKEKQKRESKKTLQTHLYNFSPSRLKNRAWQRNIGKRKKRKKWLLDDFKKLKVFEID